MGKEWVGADGPLGPLSCVMAYGRARRQVAPAAHVTWFWVSEGSLALAWRSEALCIPAHPGSEWSPVAGATTGGEEGERPGTQDDGGCVSCPLQGC